MNHLPAEAETFSGFKTRGFDRWHSVPTSNIGQLKRVTSYQQSWVAKLLPAAPPEMVELLRMQPKSATLP